MPELTLARLPDRGILRVAGAEARRIPAGPDQRRRRPARARPGALRRPADPAGQVLFDFMLSTTASILLDAELGRLPALLPAPHHVPAALAGDDRGCGRRSPWWRCSARTRAPLADPPRAATPVALVDRRRPRGELGCAPCCRPRSVDGLVRRAGAGPGAARRPTTATACALGVPDGSRDLVPEQSLLLESGFEELNGVSFDQGLLRRPGAHRAHQASRPDQEAAGPGAGRRRAARARHARPRGKRDAGEMRSGLGDRALALLRLEQAAAALRAGAARVDGSRIVPGSPAWMRYAALSASS